MIPGYGMGPGPGSGVCEGSDGEGGTGGREGYCFPVRCRNRRGVRVIFGGGVDGVSNGGGQGFSGVGSRVGIGCGYPSGGLGG